MHNVITFPIRPPGGMRYRTKRASNRAGCYCCRFLLQKQTVKRSAQCHVLAQSPSGRRPNDKYPVNTSYSSDLCKNVTPQCYLIAMVVHTQSVRCQICVYTHCAQYGDGGGAKEIKNIATTGNAACQGNISACRWFDSPAV